MMFRHDNRPDWRTTGALPEAAWVILEDHNHPDHPTARHNTARGRTQLPRTTWRLIPTTAGVRRELAHITRQGDGTIPPWLTIRKATIAWGDELPLTQAAETF